MTRLVPLDPFSFEPLAVRDAAADLARAEADALRAASLRRQAAEAHALRELAEITCPPDLIAWGRQHGIPNFAEVSWQAGFSAGWQAALARLARAAEEKP